MGALAHALVPELAELCTVHVIDGQGVVRRIDAVHADPSRVEVTRDAVHRYGPKADSPLHEIFRTGKPVFMPIVTDAYLAQIAHDPAHLMILRKFGPKSSIQIPIDSAGRTVAVLVLSLTDSPLRYGVADFELAIEVARRASHALDELDVVPPSSSHG